MAAIDAAAVAALLVELGRRTALTGDNYFRAKAYQRAADTLSALVEPLDRVIAENRLRQLPGIGETIADIITKLQRTGTHPLLDKLRKDIPEGVLDMLSIPGLKPDKINIIHRELGITDLAALEAAAREDRLKQVKGLGAAVQRKILEGLKIRETRAGRPPFAPRRRVGALGCRNAGAFGARSDPHRHRRRPPPRWRTRFEPGCRCGGRTACWPTQGNHLRRDVGVSDRCAPLRRQPAFATGSSKHLEALQQRAAKRGMTLKPEGLRRERKIIAAANEAEIYGALALQYIEPELREGLDEIERARRTRSPARHGRGPTRGSACPHYRLGRRRYA